jgi:hypothetical protein
VFYNSQLRVHLHHTQYDVQNVHCCTMEHDYSSKISQLYFQEKPSMNWRNNTHQIINVCRQSHTHTHTHTCPVSHCSYFSFATIRESMKRIHHFTPQWLPYSYFSTCTSGPHYYIRHLYNGIHGFA